MTLILKIETEILHISSIWLIAMFYLILWILLILDFHILSNRFLLVILITLMIQTQLLTYFSFIQNSIEFDNYIIISKLQYLSDHTLLTVNILLWKSSFKINIELLLEITKKKKTHSLRIYKYLGIHPV